MYRARSVFLVVVALIALALPGTALAQGTADIVGRVTDTSGAVLPGASVTTQNVATNISQNTVTSETGDYLFTLLPIGTYTVKIELQGFQTQNTRVTLSTGDRARVDGKLAVGSLSETVQVTGEAPLLNTDTSTVSNLVNEKQVQDLPVNGRNFYRLVQLVPGATEGPANSMLSGNRPDDRRVTSAVSINGAPENLNNQMIDGIDNNERGIGTVTVKPSMDAIAEVRVQTNLYSADTGRTAGGIINVLTKSGTNQFHGSAYDFERNDRFDSRDYFATTDPVLKQHQVGGSIGGPILSNKTFFFGDYEYFNNTHGLVNNLTLPTMKMRTGDFSELLPNTVIYDPTTNPRVPFDGNIIPANRLDPIVQKYMSLLPAPTTSGLANNYQATTIGSMQTHTADGRIDHRFNAGNSLFARFSMNNANVLQPGGCDPATSGPFAGISAVCRDASLNNFPGTNHTTAQGYQGNFVRVFNPTLIGEFKAGYTHLNLNTYPTNYQTNASTLFGLPNVDLNDIANGQGLATVTINGFTPLGDGTFLPLLSHGNTQQYSATITKTMGSHSLKIGGGDVLREWGVIKSSSPLGTWTFGVNETRSSTNAGGNSMASFILGYPATVTRQHYPFRPSLHVQEPSVFAQDDWRTTSWLTVNLGLRYEVFTPYTEANNNISNMQILDVATPVVLVPGQTSDKHAGIKTDYSNIQPRLGFAATLPRNYVIRGGYGITFFPGNIASPYDMKNPPITPSYGPVTSAADTGGTPDILFDSGLPVFDYTSRPSIALTDLTGSFAAVDVNFKSTRMQQFNAQVEKELKGNVVTVGYVGARGDHVTTTSAIDRAPAGPGTVQPRRKYFSVLPGLTSINVAQSILTNAYDAVQFQFQRRFSKGLSINTHYRLSHGTNQQQSPWDYTIIENVDAGQDIGHAWVFQANYALPFASHTTGVVHGLAAGWQVNAVANWQGGIPFGVTNSSARSNTGGTDRPDQIASPVLPKSQRTVTTWFNTAAYVAQAANTVGNADPIAMHGPPQRRLDLSFFKDLHVHANNTIQLRYEVYNVMNVANFQNPVSTFGSSNFGSLTSTGNSTPRQMQFAVKYLF